MGISFFASDRHTPIGDGSCTDGYWSHALILLPQLSAFIDELAVNGEFLSPDMSFDLQALFSYDVDASSVVISDSAELDRLMACCHAISKHEDYPFFAPLIDALTDWTRPQA